MARRKLSKFDEFHKLTNTADYLLPDFDQKLEDFLAKYPSIRLELACGKGEYTVGLATESYDVGHVGIDIKSDRMVAGARRAREQKLENVLFLRMNIENLTKIFLSHSVQEIWITFPDPFPRKGDKSKRLVAPEFLEMYKQILRPEGVVHFKTDNDGLFEYAIKTIAAAGAKLEEVIWNVHDPSYSERNELQILTTFERKHMQLGAEIKYLRLRFC